jgi:hypothetical protein
MRKFPAITCLLCWGSDMEKIHSGDLKREEAVKGDGT